MNRSSFGQSILSRLSALLAVIVCVSAAPAAQPAETTAPPAAVQESASADKKANAGQDDASEDAKKAAAKKAKADAKKGWKPLRGSWIVSQFGGDGPVEIEDNLIKVEIGDPMTGVRWEGDLLRENYEVELEARRTDGFDFFLGLTFPIGKANASFILGGWGGGTVGISSIDDRDASDNQTTSFRNFHDDQWYRVRVRVEPNEVRCWIDDKPAAEHDRHGHKFDIRYEMDQCVPLGIAAFQCDAEYRNLRIRKLSKKEIAAAKKKPADAEPAGDKPSP